MLCTKDHDFEQLVQHKLKPLVHAINMQADVIVGDFNSVMAENQDVLARMLDAQKQYFKQGPCKGSELPEDLDTKIERWNTSPHNTLIKAGYAYSAAKNEADSFTNFRGKTIVDHIYYRHKNIKVISEKSTILDKHGIDYQNGGFDCKGSDHNPVAFKVEFMPIAQAKLVQEKEAEEEELVLPTAQAKLVEEKEAEEEEELVLPTAKAKLVEEKEAEEEEELVLPTAQAKLVQEKAAEEEELVLPTAKAKLVEEKIITLTDNTPIPIRLLHNFEKTFCTVL